MQMVGSSLEAKLYVRAYLFFTLRLPHPTHQLIFIERL
jgi:hypothetical protein